MGSHNMAETVLSLADPKIVQVISMRCQEKGVYLNDKEILAVIEAIFWMKHRLEIWSQPQGGKDGIRR